MGDNLSSDMRGMVYMSFCLFLFRFNLFAFSSLSCLLSSYDTSFWRLTSLRIHVQLRCKSTFAICLLCMAEYLAKAGMPLTYLEHVLLATLTTVPTHPGKLPLPTCQPTNVHTQNLSRKDMKLEREARKTSPVCGKPSNADS